MWSGAGPGRPRTARRRTPEATAIRRVSWAPMRAVARRRCSLPGAPGDRLGGIESRSATSRTVVSEARIQPGTSSVSLIAGRG